VIKKKRSQTSSEDSLAFRFLSFLGFFAFSAASSASFAATRFLSCFSFRVWVLGVGFWDSGFRGFRVQGPGFRIQDVGGGVKVFGFIVQRSEV